VEVAELLDRLGHDWTVLDTVPIDDREPPVEHVVIGPPGVFSITIRNHASERARLAAFRREIARARRLRLIWLLLGIAL
jgi:hypothetical protein